MPTHDLLIIGSGPGGYTAAIRAAQLGMDVACVDEHEESGGTCLRVGCIPSKALLESSEWYVRAVKKFDAHGVRVSEVTLDLDGMHRRKDRVVRTLVKGIDALIAKNKITRYTGRARLVEAGRVAITSPEGETLVECSRVLIATGSKPAVLPGLDFSDDRVSTSTEALAYDRVPERLVVIGAGYIGLEIGTVWSRLGAEVTIVEYQDRILPGADREIAAQAKKILERQGLRFLLNARVESAKSVDGGEAQVVIDGHETLSCDRVLVAVGRVPNTEGLGLEEVGVNLSERGFIEVNGEFKTGVSGVYAVGDVVGGAMLAHKAEKEGVACVEGMAGHPVVLNYDAIPSVAYTDPEIAAVGATEEQLVNRNVEYRKGTFPFRANGRARCLDDTDGVVKVLADAETDRVLGVHIVGPRAGDLIAEAVAAIEFGASSEDIIHLTHAHPSLSEGLKEAAMAVHGRTIHM